MAEFEHLEELVVGLFDRQELGFAATSDDFIKLKSGRMSPTFFNGRRVMSFSSQLEMPLEQQARVAQLTAEGYAHGIDQAENQFDHIVNLPQAVNPVIGAVALISGKSLLYLRTPEGEKGYGKHQPIEGVYDRGDVVAGIDNVISNGDTKVEVTEPIEQLGGLVMPEFVVLLDREEGGRAALHTAGYALTSVIGMRAATQILLDNGRIRPEQAEWSFDYVDQYDIPVN